MSAVLARLGCRLGWHRWVVLKHHVGYSGERLLRRCAVCGVQAWRWQPLQVRARGEDGAP